MKMVWCQVHATTALLYSAHKNDDAAAAADDDDDDDDDNHCFWMIIADYTNATTIMCNTPRAYIFVSYEILFYMCILHLNGAKVISLMWQVLKHNSLNESGRN